jgi:type II secretory ATPase GspE/PulE/Tfp pilus assembly ATPase PilB-like protein
VVGLAILVAVVIGAGQLLADDGASFALFAQMRRGSGNFLNIWKALPILLLFLAWTATTHWVNDDCHSLRINAVLWNSAIIFSGLVGLLAPFLIDMWAVGFVVFALLFLTPTLIYVYGVRNPMVPDNAKVLTPEHLYFLLACALAKVGINLPVGAEGGTVEGPPIRFIGKTTTGRVEDTDRVRNAEGSRGYMGARELVYDAIVRRSTDIHLEPAPTEMLVRYRIDGILHNSDPFDRPTGDAIINVFKVLAAMDITEKRKPQDGSFGAVTDKRSIDFRVATSGSATGEKMVIRILDAAGALMRLEKLGLSKKLIKQVHDLAVQPYGMLLCSGPTGAGKSTTLYACLQEIDRFTRNVITIEDPVEYHLDSITQIEINTKSGQTFAASLRSILRQDPDVILVGEIRDKETADTACQAAQTGHMVFSTVHANDSITTIFRLLDLGADPGNLGASLSGVLAQRLVRALCSTCKEAYRPNPETLKKANLDNKGIEVLHRPPKQPQVVCPDCNGIGYFGRTGVFELLTVTDRMRDMIRDKASLREFKHEARKAGIEYLQEYGLKLAAQGKTSIQEVMRVVK